MKIRRVPIINFRFDESIEYSENIEKLLQDKGTTMVPLEIFTARNRVKVKIGVVKGKKLYDKRETIKNRDLDRDLKRYI